MVSSNFPAGEKKNVVKHLVVVMALSIHLMKQRIYESSNSDYFWSRTLKFLKLCSLPLCQANKKNYYYYHICVSWIFFFG